MNQLNLFCCLLFFSNPVHALITREGGGSRPTDALSIHQDIVRQNYPRLMGEVGRPAFADVVTGDGVAKSPLVLTSVVMHARLSVRDFLMRSWAGRNEKVAEDFLRPLVPGLVRANVRDGERRASLMAAAFTPDLIRAATHLPHKDSVDFDGPVAVQLLSRRKLRAADQAPGQPQIQHQPIAAIGIRAEWWPEDGGARQGRVLATFPSGQVDVEQASTETSLGLKFTVDQIKLLDRALTERAGPSALKGKIRLTAHLLTDDFATVAAYPVAGRTIRRMRSCRKLF